MKKILFFMYSFVGGGAERTVLNIMNNLDREKFHPVLVIGTDKNSPYLEKLKKDIKVINLNVRRLRDSIIPLRKYIIIEKPDILFSTINQYNITLSIAQLISFQKNKLILREASHRTESGQVNIFNKVLTHITYNFIADSIVALSNGVKEDLAQNFKIKPNKIEVVYNPIEVNCIETISNEEVYDYEFDKKTKTLIAVGRLVEQKDYETLLTAFKLLKDKDAKLIILGKGPLEKKLKDLCISLDLCNRVSFLGFKKNPYKYMRRSDVFVLSSKCEGFGHVIVEAMACGTPVISTDCKSGPAEIIKNDEYGILVPMNNPKILAKQIDLLLFDEKSRSYYAKKGNERALHFQAKNITKQYEKLF